MHFIQNKRKSNMHKENNTKIKNIEKYKKIHSLLTVLNSVR
jgi:hypothetical protein